MPGMRSADHPQAITRCIRADVQSVFVPERSAPFALGEPEVVQ